MAFASKRVASLLPSATEILCLLGHEQSLVGVSHECDHPPGVRGLPVLTRTRRALPERSADIDRDVRALLEGALAVYEIELEALRDARPDLIVTQDLCEVCAVSLAEVERAVAELGVGGARILSLRPTRLADVWEDVRRVARALGEEERAERELAGIERRIAAVRERAARLSERPATLTIEWLDPVLIGGTWMPELVELAGGCPLVTRPGQHAPTLSQAELRALDPAPELVLVKPCGFDLERSFREEELLRSLLERTTWPAVREGRVFVADGNAFFNRPGPRLVESLEILAACLHPAEFSDLAARHASSFVRLAPR